MSDDWLPFVLLCPVNENCVSRPGSEERPCEHHDPDGAHRRRPARTATPRLPESLQCAKHLVLEENPVTFTPGLALDARTQKLGCNPQA